MNRPSYDNLVLEIKKLATNMEDASFKVRQSIVDNDPVESENICKAMRLCAENARSLAASATPVSTLPVLHVARWKMQVLQEGLVAAGKASMSPHDGYRLTTAARLLDDARKLLGEINEEVK